MANRIFLRADGNSKTGLGHIYRCLAMAEIFSDDHEVIFITRSDSAGLLQLIEQYCDSVIPLQESGVAAEAESVAAMLHRDDTIILDGYHFDTAYQQAVAVSGARLVCVDDIYSYHFSADIVINHAGGIDPSVYSIDKKTKLLLGPAYAIVRSVFWNKPVPGGRAANAVFVCLGGADPNNDLVTVLKQALAKKHDLTYHVVTGSAYKHASALEALIYAFPQVHHHSNLDAPAIKSLMEQCGIAICSPSTVSYEYLSIGGELYLYTIADNQVNIFNYCTTAGLAFPFSFFGDAGEGAVAASLKKQHAVFDGKSHLRIQEAVCPPGHSH